MRLLWLDLNSSYAHSSLALSAIHAQVMDDDSVEWDIVSATINENVGMVVEDICRHSPDIIAATAWLFNHEQLMHITSRVKALLPKTCIVMGGPEFLGDNEEFLRSKTFVSCVFRGEGEEVFPQWLKCYDRQECWTDIKGLCYIDDKGVYKDNGKAMVQDFASLVPPEKSRFFNWSKPFVQIETTRGCFNTCAFCVSGGEKPVRTLSLEEVERRLDIIHKNKIKNVRVLDRTFNYNQGRAGEMLQLFKKYYPDIKFHLEIHPALLNEDIKKMLAEMPEGLLHLEAGIQSLREEVLKVSCRAGRLEDAMSGLRYLCSLDNIVTHADLIAGLPLYKLEEMFEDVRILAELNAGEIQLESLKLLPGTEMRRRAKELGISYSPLPPYEVLQTNEISVTELQTARRLSRLLDAFYNTPAWQQLTREMIISDKNFLHNFLDYLISTNQIDQPMSLEKRGLILYEYCKANYPEFAIKASVAWIEAGMSLKKTPAEKVKTRRMTPPESWNIIYGEYRDDMRLCFLPTEDNDKYGVWFGYETRKQEPRPVFKAINTKV